MSSLREVSNNTSTLREPSKSTTTTTSTSTFAGLGRVGNPVSQQSQNQQQNSRSSNSNALQLFSNLLKDFGESIGIPDLELDQNRCSLMLGEADDSVQLTMELSQDGTLCFYTIIDKKTEGIPGSVKEYINNQPGSEDGTFLSLNSAGTTVFLCLNSELKGLNGLDFESLVRAFYSAANEWKRKYDKLSKPMSANSALLNRPAAKSKKIQMEIYVDKATGFLAIAYIIYRMGGILA
ncbi:MAG: type III secretion system chaperone [Blastocatellia bacterium]|nr:type III secretion system chaperone [Blastocatellia bacterium]